MITVYIPSIYSNLLPRMVDDFSNQTVPPEKIIVIDNRPDEWINIKENIKQHYPLLDIIPKNPEMSVNDVWNFAMQDCPKGHHLCISSDDMRLELGFLEQAQKSLNTGRSVGAVSPHLAVLQKEVDMNDRPPTGSGSKAIPVIGKGNAGIFMINKGCVKSIPLIPTDAGIHFFFGDNWIGSKLQDMGYRWFRFIDSLCYHGPRTRDKDVQRRLREERRIYAQFQE